MAPVIGQFATKEGETARPLPSAMLQRSADAAGEHLEICANGALEECTAAEGERKGVPLNDRKA